MNSSRMKLTKEEIQQAIGSNEELYPAVLDTKTLAQLLKLSPKTIYDWTSRGFLDGTFRRRGKHNLFWRDRVLDRIFNGPEWRTNNE